ncbi:DUF305 domain-containing protein [Jannaschia sp. W003]|uniref:DUF305 domain-containing protein n=1 Tax=Jannaschia sp. W003 TaxID=2867012 RepID=UPI0021A555DD|nr:DUF305 domain-containing protein [Jannaschia sp. W003]UWQ22090.1 DUF305 domain-containing protein [Jannaschia sp. W003]
MKRHDDHSGGSNYGRLILMVLTSTVVMYFFMYWNIYRLEDFWLSETRAFMAMLMGGTMLAIMLAFMLHMYRNRAVNVALFAASAVLFALGLWLVRSQVTVQDSSWMRSMIPHHSIAIMVSERAELSDPRVRKLADEIIAAQEREIAEMAYLIAALERGEAVEAPLGEGEGETPVGTVSEALSSAVVAGLDLAPMTEAEVDRVVPDARCTFRFSPGQGAIAAVGADGTGVAKLSGTLVEAAAEGGAEGAVLRADDMTVTITPAPDGAADAVFELAAGAAPLRVGYRGLYECRS